MAKAKKGDRMGCNVCGLVVSVDEACGCETAEIICCDKPMVKKRAAAAKKPQAKAPAKAAAKAKAKAKPAAKKPAAKKPARAKK
jgi:hypothetical protein